MPQLPVIIAEIADKMWPIAVLMLVNLAFALVAFGLTQLFKPLAAALIPATIWWAYGGINEFFLDQSFHEAVVRELGVEIIWGEHIVDPLWLALSPSIDTENMHSDRFTKACRLSSDTPDTDD